MRECEDEIVSHVRPISVLLFLLRGIVTLWKRPSQCWERGTDAESAGLFISPSSHLGAHREALHPSRLHLSLQGLRKLDRHP